MIRLRRLSVQLIVWFAAIALVPLSIVTVLTYLAARSALRDQVTTGLYATARRQANQLATYVREREQNVARFRACRARLPRWKIFGALPPGASSLVRLSTFSTASIGRSCPTTRKRSAMTTSRWSFPMAASSSRRGDGTSAPICAPILTGLQDSASNSIVSGLCSTSTSPISRLRARRRRGRRVPGSAGLRQEQVPRCGPRAFEHARDPQDRVRPYGTRRDGRNAAEQRIDERAVIMVPLRRGPTRRLPGASRSAVVRHPEQRSVQGSRAKAYPSIIRTGPSSPSGATCRTRCRTRGENRRREAYAPIRYLTLLAIILGTTVALVVVAARSLGRSPARS